MKHLIKAKGEGICQGFRLCQNKATTSIQHFIKGEVAVCESCKQRLEDIQNDKTDDEHE